MAEVIANRMTVEIEGDFVVFLIGMRVNKPWKIHKWLPVLLAMPKMLRELEKRPDSGSWGTSSA
jgi:fumigallin biosynthesis monooxygenase-like protein